MRKEDLLSDEFLKQFKTGEDLNGFLAQLQKRGLEAILNGELDAHLGYDKHEKSSVSNSRNGYSNKKIKTSFGESEIQVPRDRQATFNPMIVPKRQNMVDGLENVIVSLYAKAMSVSDIEEQIREVYNFDISTSTISRITESVANDIIAWQNRPSYPVYSPEEINQFDCLNELNLLLSELSADFEEKEETCYSLVVRYVQDNLVLTPVSNACEVLEYLDENFECINRDIYDEGHLDMPSDAIYTDDLFDEIPEPSPESPEDKEDVFEETERSSIW